MSNTYNHFEIASIEIKRYHHDESEFPDAFHDDPYHPSCLFVGRPEQTSIIGEATGIPVFPRFRRRLEQFQDLRPEATQKDQTIFSD